MKKIYTAIVALVTSLALQAQVPTSTTPKGELDPKVQAKLMPQHLSAQRDSRTTEQMTQNPKWLTNLPVDSAIFRQEFIPYAEGSTAWFSTVYSEDLTKFFVGNRIKTIKTLIPKSAKDITVWIKRVSRESEELLWESHLPDTVKTNEIIDIPCDLLINECYRMQVGFNYTVTETDPVYPAIVPCNRQEAWIQGQSDTDGGRPLDYTTMRNIIYGDPNPFYGYYFHCITEGDAGLPDYDIQLKGVSHNRVPLGGDTECNVTFQSYGAKAIDSLTFISSTPVEKREINIQQAVPYLGYGHFKTTAKAAPEPSRIPLAINISKIDGKPTSEKIGVEGSIIAIDEKESFVRNVVMEEFTGTWCGWCPRGMKSIEMLQEEFGQNFIPIAVHINDKMQDDSFYEVSLYNNGNFPGCTLNRIVQCEPYYGTSSNNSPFFIYNDVESIMNRLTEATLKIDEVNVNENKVSITTSSQFNINCDMESYAMSYVVTEDGVKDVQTNYYSIHKDQPQNVEEDLRELTQLPERWLTEFSHVGRSAYEPLGVAGSLPKNIRRNCSMSFTYEFDLPKNVKNKNKLHIVALLLDTKTGEIVNAEQLHISKANVSGIAAAGTDSWAEINVNKNLVKVKANQAQVQIYQADGKLVKSAKINGVANFTLQHGTFVVRVEHDNKVLVRKVML